METNPILCCRLAACSLILIIIIANIFCTEAGIVGVNYGRQGNNLPSPSTVVSLLRSKNIDRVRLFNPDADALNALRGSGIQVILNVPNDDLQRLRNPAAARNWINTNIVPYANVRFRYLAVGNEVIPGGLATHVLLAMQNLNSALKAVGRGIPVSTCVHSPVVANSFPPSAGQFSSESGAVMRSIVEFLVANRFPLLVNIYPYFSYVGNPKEIQLDYALFTANRVVFTDPDGNRPYRNLFDALTDVMYAALEKVGGRDIEIVITESGWPSAQNANIATIPNARTYVNNLVSHVSGTSGTPRRPGKSIETYIFNLFNENLKGGDPTEKYFGLYYPDMTEVYGVVFRDEEKCCNLNMYQYIIS